MGGQLPKHLLALMGAVFKIPLKALMTGSKNVVVDLGGPLFMALLKSPISSASLEDLLTPNDDDAAALMRFNAIAPEVMLLAARIFMKIKPYIDAGATTIYCVLDGPSPESKNSSRAAVGRESQFFKEIRQLRADGTPESILKVERMLRRDHLFRMVLARILNTFMVRYDLTGVFDEATARHGDGVPFGGEFIIAPYETDPEVVRLSLNLKLPPAAAATTIDAAVESAVAPATVEFASSTAGKVTVDDLEPYVEEFDPSVPDDWKAQAVKLINEALKAPLVHSADADLTMQGAKLRIKSMYKDNITGEYTCEVVVLEAMLKTSNLPDDLIAFGFYGACNKTDFNRKGVPGAGPAYILKGIKATFGPNTDRGFNGKNIEQLLEATRKALDATASSSTAKNPFDVASADKLEVLEQLKLGVVCTRCSLVSNVKDALQQGCPIAYLDGNRQQLHSLPDGIDVNEERRLIKITTEDRDNFITGRNASLIAHGYLLGDASQPTERGKIFFSAMEGHAMQIPDDLKTLPGSWRKYAPNTYHPLCDPSNIETAACGEIARCKLQPVMKARGVHDRATLHLVVEAGPQNAGAKEKKTESRSFFVSVVQQQRSLVLKGIHDLVVGSRGEATAVKSFSFFLANDRLCCAGAPSTDICAVPPFAEKGDIDDVFCQLLLVLNDAADAAVPFIDTMAIRTGKVKLHHGGEFHHPFGFDDVGYDQFVYSPNDVLKSFKAFRRLYTVLEVAQLYKNCIMSALDLARSCTRAEVLEILSRVTSVNADMRAPEGYVVAVAYRGKRGGSYKRSFRFTFLQYGSRRAAKKAAEAKALEHGHLVVPQEIVELALDKFDEETRNHAGDDSIEYVPDLEKIFNEVAASDLFSNHTKNTEHQVPLCEDGDEEGSAEDEEGPAGPSDMGRSRRQRVAPARFKDNDTT